MRVLLLGSKATLLIKSLESKGHTYAYTDKVLEQPDNFDFIISFGYRYIIKKNIIDIYKDKIINIHISYLPYNKGADPNLWSILENTKKGVTIHKISENLDEGEIILRKEVFFKDTDTLKSSYETLINEAVSLFTDNMDSILSSCIKSFPQEDKGSKHKSADKLKYAYLTEELGYDTPIGFLKGKGYAG